MSAPTLVYRAPARGLYVATAPIAGEAAAFQARINRDPAGGWRLTTMTWGLPLGSEPTPTLAAARTMAQAVLDAVWSA